jgi:hypothetical protein
MRFRSNRVCFGLAIFSAVALFGEEQETHDLRFSKAGPWFTGPLIAPGAQVVPVGRVSLEPTVDCSIYKGFYDAERNVIAIPKFYETEMLAFLRVGVLPGVAFRLTPEIIVNETEGQKDWGVGDMPIGLDFQLFTGGETIWPNIRLSLRANIPIGKYDHLKPEKKGTDAIGGGSWMPSAFISMSRIWQVQTRHYLEARLLIRYQVGTAVKVKGLNSYGGTSNTKGYVYPGNEIAIDAALQYNLNQRWGLSCDLFYSYDNKTRFSGMVGVLPDGTSAQMVTPAGEQWSLAPAIQYNWSKNIGVISGVWFSFSGKNSSQFISPTIAANMYF